MDDIQQVRRFNRLVTKRVGALDDSFLARGRPLGEARVIHEVGSGGATDLQTLRATLGLDSGYMSRLLRSLEKQELIALAAKPGDSRAKLVRLTEAGAAEFAAYDAGSDRLARTLLSALDAPRRQRLVKAMGEVERLLLAASIDIAPAVAASDDAQWCLTQYYAELQARFDAGFDPDAGKPVDVSDMEPPKGWFLMARLDQRPAGCGALIRLDDGTGEIKRVWAAPELRGLGVATGLMDRLEDLARDAGFARVRLDTNGVLTEAQAMYRKRGYREIARYNDNPYAEHWFEKDL